MVRPRLLSALTSLLFAAACTGCSGADEDAAQQTPPNGGASQSGPSGTVACASSADCSVGFQCRKVRAREFDVMRCVGADGSIASATTATNGDGGTPGSDAPLPGESCAPGSVAASPSPLVLSTSDRHTCAALPSGGVECWGLNTQGELGTDSLAPSATPVAVQGLAGASAIATGYFHSCALVGGQVQCWGNSAEGQLGNGTRTNSNVAVNVTGLSNAITITAGSKHTCAIVSGGDVLCWGDDFDEQLGIPLHVGAGEPFVLGLTPVAVPGVSGAAAIAAGDAHTCAIVLGGEVRCWGSNYSHASGNPSADVFGPVNVVSGISNAAVIAAGGQRTCVIGSGGQIRCWGNNHLGGLGDGTTIDSATPVPVSGVTGVVGAHAIAVGRDHACAIDACGRVKCWGGNGRGQLGNGTTTNSAVAVTVSGLPGAASAVFAGADQTCAIVSGALMCWGANHDGVLGAATPSTCGGAACSLVPVVVGVSP